MMAYGVGIDAGQIQNMMETDVNEVLDLLTLRLLAFMLLIVGLPLLWLWSTPAAALSWKQTLRNKLFAVVLGLVSMLALAGWHYADYASTFREHRELRYLIVPLLAADKARWCNDGECHDDLLADTFADYISRATVNDRVVVLHQEGSHGPAYYRRYPDAFKRFTPTCDSNALQSCTQQQVINTYDNTIAYTDHILGRIIDTLKGQDDRYQTVMVYASDHGESTGEHGLYLHGAPYLFAPSQQTHVPMMAWLSPDFQQQGPSSSCLTNQAQKPQSHDTIFHSFLGLLGVKTAVYNATLDWSDACQR